MNPAKATFLEEFESLVSFESTHRRKPVVRRRVGAVRKEGKVANPLGNRAGS